MHGLDIRIKMGEDGASGVCWGGGLAKGGRGEFLLALFPFFLRAHTNY
jgi:hypothetical protein